MPGSENLINYLGIVKSENLEGNLLLPLDKTHVNPSCLLNTNPV